ATATANLVFSPLFLRHRQSTSVAHAEDHPASVAAASVVAKVIRDDRFNAIRLRYEPELGPIAGGGYANASTRRWLRAYVELYGKLPDEARRSWPHPYVHDLIGDTRMPGPQAELFG